jgi:hypothetical protein
MMETRSCRTLLFTLIAVLAVGGQLFGAQPASADPNCIQDVWKAHGNNQNLTCTAQDVTLSSATNIHITQGGQCPGGKCECFAGQPLTFTADFRMDLTADTRYDVGFYIATDNDPNHDGAKTGQCSATASLASNTVAPSAFTQLDAAGDVCGDITGPLSNPINSGQNPSNPLFVRATISTTCPTSAGQQLVLPFCTTWRQPGSNEVCGDPITNPTGIGNGTTTNGVYPGSPSKCNCGNLAIDITSVTTTITVTKAALTTSVPETGGPATYSVTVSNSSGIAVTVTSLVDDKYGNITATHLAGKNCDKDGNDGTCRAVTATTCVPDADTTTCQVGGAIAAGAQCSCTFTGPVPAGDFPGSDTDTVTGCANNATNPTPVCDDGSATVPYTDVPQPPSLTKTAAATSCRIDQTYDVVVTNGSAQDTLTLNTLSDNVYGNITTAAGASCTGTCIVSTTCGQSPGPGTLPAVIAASGNYSCSFVGRTSSCNATVHDTVTGGAVDDDGASYTPSDDATIVISVTK